MVEAVEATADIVVAAVDRKMPLRSVVSKKEWTGNCTKVVAEAALVAAVAAAAVEECNHQNQPL